MKKILISILVLVLLLLTGFIFWFNTNYEYRQITQRDEFIFVLKKRPDAEAIKKAQENELQRRAPIDIPVNAVPIQEIKDRTKPVVAFFYVDWCGFCKRFMPIYGEVAKEYSNKYNFAVVHCEKPENQALVNEFEIRAFPSLFIIDNKINHKFALSGSVTQDKNALERELDNYIKVRKHFSK